MTLPNLITIARLIAVPLVIMAIAQGHWDWAFFLFVLAGVSDAVDGWLAKSFNMASELGAYLDPIADKALLVSIYVTLAVTGGLPVWIVILVVARDVMIVSAVILSWVMAKPLAIKPLVIPSADAQRVGLMIVAGLTLASMGAYLVLWIRHMASDEAMLDD